jgi:glycolate oxidase FAD binding subunit
MTDKIYQPFVERVDAAYHSGQALNICGASSKAFYGAPPSGLALPVRDNRGIIDYDPAELVMVARAGTKLKEVQSALTEQGQMLGFEPPFAEQDATLGGAIASGLAGAGRPYRGGVRDYLLGTKSIDGRAQITQFGGRVMKNVAGFDLFRPMAGAMGTLGVLLEASLRVIPIPEQEISVEFDEENKATAIKTLCAYGKQLPGLSASGWFQGKIQLRLSGSQLAVNRGIKLLKSSHTVTEIDNAYWLTISQFEHPFFELHGLNETVLQDSIVAIDVPPASPPVDLPGAWLIDWGGARRYLKTSLNIAPLRQVVEEYGGSATQLKGEDRTEFFHPLSPSLMSLQHRLKKSFDPKGILNPGRLYPDL